jgi:hypothetical protein
LRITPAMAAGVTERLWAMEDIVRIADEREAAELATLKRLKLSRVNAARISS